MQEKSTSGRAPRALSVCALPLAISMIAGSAWAMSSTETAKSEYDTRPERAVIARVSVSATAAHWEAPVTEAVLFLTVSGPGEFWERRVFQPGVVPHYELPAGAPEGTYTYELREVPATLEAAARDSSERLAVQTGRWSVREGVFDPAAQDRRNPRTDNR